MQVGQLREFSNKNHNAELKLFLEIETGQVWVHCQFGTCQILIDLCQYDLLAQFAGSTTYITTRKK